MFIDTHCHESKYSLDSKVSLEEIVARAKEIGLDGICITDHDDNNIRHEARALAESLGYLIIPGVEILTHEGDIVVFGVDELPQRKMHASELLEYVNCRGGVGIAAHPFRNNNRGLGDNIRVLPGLAGIEGYNGNTDLQANLKACSLGTELGLPLFGASDAHHRTEVGCYATFFAGKIRNEAEFVMAVRAGKTRPATYLNGSYQVLDVND